MGPRDRSTQPGRYAALAFLLTLAAILLATAVRADPPQPFTDDERAAILLHGPWPPPMRPDPSNRVSGKPKAIALGRLLFLDKRLSRDGEHACASCHGPDKAFADGRPRSLGIGGVVLDRNAIALANLGLQRWYGWAGAGDSLWMQSIRPILDAKELALTPEALKVRIAGDAVLAAAYAEVLGSSAASDAAELVLVNIAKVLAAFQETILTPRTAFDDLRDALERGDADAVGRYPEAARRGLKLFVGKGQCSACHFGPNFTHGEFENIGVPHFAAKGRVDTGRFGGIKALLASPFNLLGKYNDDPVKAPGLATRHVEPLHRNWGEFRVPSLRGVSRTAPYMHSGAFATLADVVRYYSEVDEDRLHGLPGQSLIRPLKLSPEEIADLVAFLATL